MLIPNLWLQITKNAKRNIPGQGLILQSTFITEFPGQGNPPFEGAGLLHSRVLVIVPFPQVAEQAEGGFHCPQFPFTKDDKNKDSSHVR